jgi:hypothetical protein
VASGCGTDHLNLDDVKTVDDVIRGYEDADGSHREAGRQAHRHGQPRAGPRGQSPADYERVYDRILSQAKQPVVLHWLGDMFDPALAGYWGTRNVDAAMDTALGIIARTPSKVDGIKISCSTRTRKSPCAACPQQAAPGVRMYTGDDFNYAELIAGDGFGS